MKQKTEGFNTELLGKVTEFKENIQELIKDYLKDEVNFKVFTLPFDESVINYLSASPAPGVYLIQFEVKSFLEVFKTDRNNWKQRLIEFWNSQWDDMFMPKIDDSNLKNKTDLSEWIDFSVGKGLKFSKRFLNHLKVNPSKKSLNKKVDLYYGLKFRIITLNFEFENTEIQSLINKLIEDSIRDLQKPILSQYAMQVVTFNNLSAKRKGKGFENTNKQN